VLFWGIGFPILMAWGLAIFTGEKAKEDIAAVISGRKTVTFQGSR
jgi:hypothetical protein